MYSTTKASIFNKGKISETFATTKGVKQGDVLSTLLFNIFVNDLPKEISKISNDPPSLFNMDIDSLLFADDLAILALTKEGLQEKINVVDIFCKKWGLAVNVKKTKILVFNKAGATIKKHKFYLNNNEIESVKQYTYLGFTFTTSGSMLVGIENLLNKSKKAWFSVQRYLQKSSEKTVKTYLTLIDSLIKPIMLYACEAWGDIKIKKIFDSKIEKFHLSMCKQILGVTKRANNIKTLAELGRYPIYINIETQIFKYFQRFTFVDKERCVYKAFQEELKGDIGDELSWVSFIKTKLDRYGLTYLGTDILKACKSKELASTLRNKTKLFLKRLKDTYLQEQFHTLKFGMHKTLTNFKDQYDYETYLNLKIFENRRALTKLRIGAHNLLVVSGKWFKIELEERICKQCQLNKIEDEFHFTLECPIYSDIRNDCFSKIQESENIVLQKIKNLEQLYDILNKISIQAVNVFAEFVKKAFQLRQKREAQNYGYIIIF